MDILDIIQNRNNQLYSVVNFIMLIYVFSNRAKDKSKIIFIKNIRPKESLTLLLILLEIIVLAIFYIAVIIGACMSDYD